MGGATGMATMATTIAFVCRATICHYHLLHDVYTVYGNIIICSICVTPEITS